MKKPEKTEALQAVMGARRTHNTLMVGVIRFSPKKTKTLRKDRMCCVVIEICKEVSLVALGNGKKHHYREVGDHGFRLHLEEGHHVVVVRDHGRHHDLAARAPC